MKILAEQICGPARTLLESHSHKVSAVIDIAKGVIVGVKSPEPTDWGCLWTRLEPLRSEGFDSCSNIKYVCCPCTDVSHLPLDECKRRGIRVLSLRDTDVLPTITATAEHTIGLILALVRKIPCAAESTKRGVWDRSSFMGREISSMRPFVIGNGRVGGMVRKALEAMGSIVDWTDAYSSADGVGDYDIVTIHVDLNETSRGMCNADFFRSMKPGSYFINTSRGQVVDEAALLSALRDEHLAGAALDVACGEPDSINPDLVAYANEHPDRLIVTPHIGGYAAEAIEKAEVGLARKLLEVINGTERR